MQQMFIASSPSNKKTNNGNLWYTNCEKNHMYCESCLFTLPSSFSIDFALPRYKCELCSAVDYPEFFSVFINISENNCIDPSSNLFD